MNETIYQLMWFFVLYSFLGWLFATAAAASKNEEVR